MRTHFLKKKFLRSVLFIMSSFGILFLFQNCSQAFKTDPNHQLEATDSLSSNSEDESEPISQANPSLNSPQVAPLKSYIFKSEYRRNSRDLSGVKVCDYPTMLNCLSDSEGRSKGRSIVNRTPLNAASNVQIMKFEFISNSYFAKNTSAHLAIGLRGRITLDAANNPVGINGRGFIIGYVGGHPTNIGQVSCQTRHGQIETYHNDASAKDSSIYGNHVFPESCTDSIFKDGVLYKVEVLVSRDRKIGYRISNENSKLLHSYLIQDPTNYIDLNLNDWFLAHVFDTPVTTSAGEWSFIIKNIQFSESNISIDRFFNQKVIQFQLGSQALNDNSLVTLDQIRNQGLGSVSYTAERGQVYGCASPVSAIDAGVACRNAEGFRAIKLSSDPAFVKIEDRLQVIPESFSAFPANTYKLILRLNPLDSQNQSTVRILKN